MTTLNALIATFLMQMPPIALPPIPQVQYIPAPPPVNYVAPDRYYRYYPPGVRPGYQPPPVRSRPVSPPPMQESLPQRPAPINGQQRGLSEDEWRQAIIDEAQKFCTSFPKDSQCHFKDGVK